MSEHKEFIESSKTEVFDEVEIAQINAQNEINALIAENALKTKPEFHEGFDGKHCIDCDTEIPKARLKMGRIRCVPCQTTLERWEKLHPGKTYQPN